jgi:hypothetical protein
MKRALLVGINYTPLCIPERDANDNSLPLLINNSLQTGKNVDELKGCVSDVVRVANLLTHFLGYDAENISILRDDIGPHPTRANIMDSLSKIIDQSEEMDEIFVYYSGYCVKNASLDDCIVPVDYKSEGLITNAELFSRIQMIRSSAIFLFDCCNVGNLCSLEWVFEYRSPKYCVQNQNDENHVENTNIIVYCGLRDSSLNQPMVSTEEAIDEKNAIGMFTNAFIHCLKAKDYHYSAVYLYGDICTFLKENGESQYPYFSASISGRPAYSFQKQDSTWKGDHRPFQEETFVLASSPPPSPTNQIQMSPPRQQIGFFAKAKSRSGKMQTISLPDSPRYPHLTQTSFEFTGFGKARRKR